MRWFTRTQRVTFHIVITLQTDDAVSYTWDIAMWSLVHIPGDLSLVPVVFACNIIVCTFLCIAGALGVMFLKGLGVDKNVLISHDLTVIYLCVLLHLRTSSLIEMCVPRSTFVPLRQILAMYLLNIIIKLNIIVKLT